MEVQDWGGGLTQREIEAIDKIKKAFRKTDEVKIEKNNNKGFEALKALKSIFSWKGYSGFRFIDSQRNEGEFDLVIVTHCNVIIVELKDWNGSKVTSINDRWYLGNQERGRSAVSVTRNKKFLLERKLDKLKDKFTNKGFPPFIDFFVVMTGTADFSELPANEKNHVLSLNDFLEIRNEEVFNKLFKTHSNSKTLNQDFAIFDELVFGINRVKPKNIGFGGYYAEDEPSFKHPSNIYREFIAHSEQNKQKDIALLRHWDFTQVDRKEAQTPDGRFSLVSREYDVLQHIKNTNQQLYQSCLSYKSMPQKGELTSEHIDLFEIFSQQKRFNEFVGGYNGNNLSEDRRIGLVKILLDKFAQLHKLGIAHRDLGSHSLWLSADDKVTLSGFTTAYLSSEESVGDIREILAVSGDLAKENFPITTGQSLSPYQLDIRSLAVLAWHIIHAERISPHSLAKMQSNLAIENEWYSAILLKALSENTFDQANDFLTAFTEAQPEAVFDFTFNFANLDSFYHEIQLFRTYPETEEPLIANDIKEVYRSSNLLIKSWLGADPKKDVNQARVVFRWLEDIARLAQLNLDYIPKIREFGIAPKSGSLFIASEFIEGFDWTKIVELNLPETYKFILIDKLIQNIEHLHSSGYVHGDLKPSNVVITLDEQNENDANIYLLDVLDFSMDDDYFNTKYSPLFDNATAKQRDNFAVIKMSCELLNIDLNNPAKQYQNISEVIALENSDNKVGYISLARFKDALKPKPKSPTLDISLRSQTDFEAVQIYPENGELFVQVEKSKGKDTNDLLVKFSGLGGILRVFYSQNDKKFSNALPPLTRDEISKPDRDNSQISLFVNLNISKSDTLNLKSLNDYLKENQLLKQTIQDYLDSLRVEKPEEVIELSQNEDEDEDKLEVISDNATLHKPKIKDLWHAILDSETEALPAITASSSINKLDNGEVFIPYDGEVNPLDQFKKDEIVEAVGWDEYRDNTFKFGTVDIARSTLNELYLKPKNSRKSWDRINADTPIYLQSKQNKASYQRRKNALQRILEGESIIKDLVGYFDESSTKPAINYDIQVTDEQFKRYDRKGDHSENIALNKDQRQAFQKLISNGPLSVLQGPPGTGKSEFISAFVHYLFTEQNVKNILLVSHTKLSIQQQNVSESIVCV